MDLLREYRSVFLAYGVLLLAFTIQACGRQLEPQEPCNFVMNSQKQRVSWGYFAPAKMSIHKSVPIKYHQTIIDAANSWNELAGKQVLSVSSQINDGAKEATQDSKSIIYYLSEWEADKPNEQARTKVRWRGERILEADVSINNVNFEFSEYTTDSELPSDEVDLKSLMIHEFGHVLGLAHIDQTYSVMNSKLRKGTARWDFAGDNVEYNSLSCEY